MKAGVSGALILAVLAGGCNAPPKHQAGARHTWTAPGILRIAVLSDPKSLNPALYPLFPTPLISMFVYSWSVRYDSGAHPIPDALRELPTVANGDVSRNGMTLLYRIRRNIRWQDGLPLTCGDLRFTWQAVMNPHNNVATTDGYRDVRSIDCSDPWVAVVHMKRPYAPFLQQLWGINGNTPILPAHLLARYNDARGSFNTAPYNALPVGSGPFRVASWDRGRAIRLVSSSRFYLGAPKLREVVFKIIPDMNTAEIELLEHQVDLIAGSQMYWPRFVALASDGRNGLTAARANQFVWGHIDFNLAGPITGDRNVRVALAYATNRSEIVGKLFHNVPIPAETDQNPALSWAYTSNFVHRHFDPRRSRNILDRAGWRLGPDGIRVRRGQRLELTLSACSEYKGEVAIETLLQRDWQDVGVAANIKNYSHNLFFDNSSSGILSGGHYDVAIQSTTTGPDPDHSSLYSGDHFAPRGQNTLRWSDPLATKAMEGALRTVDLQARRREYLVVQRSLARDVPTIVLDFIREPFLYNSDLRGFRPSPVWTFWNPWNYSV
jgi:peptide/nickel transport system substrate-binding protein